MPSADIERPPDARVADGRLDPALVAILLFALALRLLWATTPITEAHTWRQITNADIARNLAEGSLDVFHPPVSWGGRDGYVGMEFPLVHLLVALLYRAFGEREIFCRLVPIAFSLVTVAGLYAIGRRLFGVPAARAAALVLAAAPSVVFFGRTFLSDTPMLCFSVLAVAAWAAWFDSSRRRDAVLATAFTALAGLVKLPGILVLAPVAWLAWEREGWRAWRARPVVVGAVVALLLTAAWYAHAHRIYLQTGLTQAIWTPSGVYSSRIALAARQVPGVSHWSSRELLGSLEFYRELVDRFWVLHLTPIGVALAAFGVVALRRHPRLGLVGAWLGIGVVFVLVSARGQYDHEFHQLPLMPPLALLAGGGAAAAFDGRWLRERAGRAGLPLAASLVVLLSMASFRDSGVVRHLFRPDRLQLDVLGTGRAIGSITPPDALLISVEYERNGNHSPVLLYYAHRKGWSLDVESLTPHVLQRLRDRFGATWFVTTRWAEIERSRPEVVRYLSQFEAVAVQGTPRNTRFIRLERRAMP